MDYKMLLIILVESEHRAATHPDAGVRQRSQETVDDVNERMRLEGITRADLERFAA